MTWNNFYTSIISFEVMLHSYIITLLEDEQRTSVGELVGGSYFIILTAKSHIKPTQMIIKLSDRVYILTHSTSFGDYSFTGGHVVNT